MEKKYDLFDTKIIIGRKEQKNIFAKADYYKIPLDVYISILLEWYENYGQYPVYHKRESLMEKTEAEKILDSNLKKADYYLSYLEELKEQ